MFGPSFLKDPARRAERERWTAELLRNRRSIIRSVRGVFARQGVLQELSNIRCPTLVLHGDEDQAITLERGETLAAAIPNAVMITVPMAGHTLTVENPQAVNTALIGFFRDVTEGSSHLVPARSLGTPND